MGWLSGAINVLEIRGPCESARVETSTRVLLTPIRLPASPASACSITP